MKKLPDLFLRVSAETERVERERLKAYGEWAEMVGLLFLEFQRTMPRPPKVMIVSTDSGPMIYIVGERSIEYVPQNLIYTMDARSGTTGMDISTDGITNVAKEERDEEGDLRKASEGSVQPDHRQA